MGDRGSGVAHTPWEYAFWGCAAAVAVLITATASSTGEAVTGGLLILTTLGLFLWSRSIHRRRPELLKQRLPSEVSYFLLLVAAFVLLVHVGEDAVIDKIIGVLMASGLVLLVVAERTRPIPEGPFEVESTGGYFDPTTRQGMNRRHWAGRFVLLGLALAGVVIGLAGNATVGFIVAAIWVFSWLFVYEPLDWLAKRKKWGYYALIDETSDRQSA